MKRIIFLLTICCFLACNKDEVCTEISYGTAIDLQTETLVCISGTEYTFVAEDERCCCDCVCIWEGQFVLYFNNADGTNAYTFQQGMPDLNEEPSFGSSMEITAISGGNEECGDEDRIDEVSFTIIIEE